MVSCRSLPFRAGLLALSFGCFSTIASAVPVTLTPNADTFITIHPVLGGGTRNHGPDAALFVIGAVGPTNPVYTATLVRFDLGAYAGQTVQGPATFSMHVQGTDFNDPSVLDRTIRVRDIAGTWNENTVTANNATLVPGGVIASRSIHYLTSVDDQYVTWTLPAAYVQNWIDTPASNGGLYIEMRLVQRRTICNSVQGNPSIRPNCRSSFPNRLRSEWSAHRHCF